MIRLPPYVRLQIIADWLLALSILKIKWFSSRWSTLIDFEVLLFTKVFNSLHDIRTAKLYSKAQYIRRSVHVDGRPRLRSNTFMASLYSLKTVTFLSKPHQTINRTRWYLSRLKDWTHGNNKPRGIFPLNYPQSSLKS